MKKNIINLVLVGVFGLMTYSAQAANDENTFRTAIDQYLNKKGELCFHTSAFPVDVAGADNLQKTQMEALASFGLAVGADEEIDQIGYNLKPTGHVVKIKRYNLTEAGKKLYQVKERGATKQIIMTGICYGKKRVEKIVKWEPPEYNETNITYLYKIEGLPEWAKSTTFKTAFRQEGLIVDGAGKKKEIRGAMLTSAGWVAKGLND